MLPRVSFEATACPHCGRTTATTPMGRCVNCAEVKHPRPRPPEERETWGDLGRLALRSIPSLLLALLVLALLAVAVAFEAAIVIGVLLAIAVVWFAVSGATGY
jgi:hypothetical protein